MCVKLGAQILVSKTLLQQREAGFLGQIPASRLKEKIKKSSLSLEHLAVPEHKEMLTNNPSPPNKKIPKTKIPQKLRYVEGIQEQLRASMVKAAPVE